jgi:hypothetical protein
MNDYCMRQLCDDTLGTVGSCLQSGKLVRPCCRHRTSEALHLCTATAATATPIRVQKTTMLNTERIFRLLAIQLRSRRHTIEDSFIMRINVILSGPKWFKV